MLQNKHIGVYLSSKSDLPESYGETAHDVGRLIGERGCTLVYGGAKKGLMEILAQSVKQHGGRIYGMVPDILVERGIVSDLIDVTFRCVNLSDRKEMMNRESDVIIALPGGIGTLDEVFTVMANATIGIRRQPLIFFNIDGCWNSTLAALEELGYQGLITGEPEDYFYTVETVEELEELLDRLF